MTENLHPSRWPKKKRGRPRGQQGLQWPHQVTGYVSAEQRDKYLALGGSEWLRSQIDHAEVENYHSN